ncbi:MAG: hypothetical protein ACI8ZF_001006, partial [Candidatus Midichloriaceae bacterium]
MVDLNNKTTLSKLIGCEVGKVSDITVFTDFLKGNKLTPSADICLGTFKNDTVKECITRISGDLKTKTDKLKVWLNDDTVVIEAKILVKAMLGDKFDAIKNNLKDGILTSIESKETEITGAAGTPDADDTTAGTPDVDDTTAGTPDADDTTAGTPDADDTTAGTPDVDDTTTVTTDEDDTTAVTPTVDNTTTVTTDEDDTTA